MHPDLVIFAGNTCLLILLIVRSIRVKRADSGNLYLILGYGFISLISLVNFFITTSEIPIDWIAKDPERFTAVLLVFAYLPSICLIAYGFLRWFDANQALYLETKRSVSNSERLTERIEHLKSALAVNEAANLAKIDFFSNIGHEFRNRLNIITGYSEGIRDQIYGPIGTKKYLEHAIYINDSGLEMLSLMSKAHALSKTESGATQLQEEAFFLRSTIKECLKDIDTHPNLGNVKLIYDEQQINEAILWADRYLVKQMLSNLLMNAIQYTPKGGSVTIQSYQTKEEDLVIEISDTGIGMEEEQILLAVEPFRRITNPMVKSSTNSGLGLALVKLFMELHGGRLKLLSTVGKGTSARLIFPNTRAVKPGDESNNL